ncbi:MAG: hypothetical protein IH631_06540 [Candidatus Thorarchaeota archaeon]|nr:hypothetical protein [Candidatus Thorarchaeota archaeon]
MKQFQNFLSIGILFIVFGIILLVVGGGLGDSIFFIFPFFFFNGSDPISIFIILGFMLVIVIFMLRSTSYMVNHQGVGKKLLVGGKCGFCSSPIPIGASFCSSCGNAINDNLTDND